MMIGTLPGDSFGQTMEFGVQAVPQPALSFLVAGSHLPQQMRHIV